MFKKCQCVELLLQSFWLTSSTNEIKSINPSKCINDGHSYKSRDNQIIDNLQYSRLNTDLIILSIDFILYCANECIEIFVVTIKFQNENFESGANTKNLVYFPSFFHLLDYLSLPSH